VIIDSFRDVDAAADLTVKREAYARMENLYHAARRKAMGVDAALDTLINELDKNLKAACSRSCLHQGSQDREKVEGAARI
jgi:hypothetical protein